jgi:multidrug transporter EmrE-like cation transporter
MSDEGTHETARLWIMSLLSILVSNLQLALGLSLMAVNIGYTIWKWRRDYVNEKRNANK